MVEFFVDGHICEVNLPVFAQLVSSELVQCLTNLEIPPKVGFGKHLAESLGL